MSRPCDSEDNCATIGNAGLRGVQAPELPHPQEPAQHSGSHPAAEVLPVVPAPHGAPGDSLGVEGSSSVGRAAVSKTAGRGFESLLPC
jgi:hypothetical protein